MNKLTHVESQRIMAVLEESVAKVNLMALLTREITASPPEELWEFMDDDLRYLLKQQKKLEETYSELLTHKKTEQTQQQLKQTGEELRLCTVTLCRLLRENQQVLEYLKQYQVAGRTQPLKMFLKSYESLKELVLNKLGTTVEEEKSKQDFLNDIQAKEQKSNAEMKSQQNLLQELRAKHDKEVQQRNNTINKLKEELQEIKASATVEMKRIEQHNSLQASDDKLAHQTAMSKYNGALDNLNTELEEKIKLHKREEQNLRKKKLKTEKEVENWVNKYDHEMQEKENEINKLTQEYEAIKQELHALEEQYQAIMKEKEEMLEEERRQQEEHLREIEQIRMINHSAMVIQRWWNDKHKKILHERKMKRKAAKETKTKGKK